MVYILSKNGKPLMPTKRYGRVRRLLKEQKAIVVKRTPFTIQLTYDTTEYVQKVSLGVDAGSKVVGVSATTEKEVLFEGMFTLRNDVVDLISTRRQYRRSRRHRKTRYRKARFLNRVRVKKKGWLAPSIRHKINSHHKIIDLVNSILPVSNIVVEVAAFDIQKIKNPEISGTGYQQGDQIGFWNVREYILWRDGYKCKGKANCKNNILNVHHIESRKKGGNAPNNLITLCNTCHKDYHSGELKLNLKRGLKFNDAAFMGIMRWSLCNQLKEKYYNVSSTFGYLTKNTRITHGLDKSHNVDARCISGNPLAKGSELFNGVFKRRQNRSLHKANPSKGGNRRVNTISSVKGFKRFDKVKYNNGVCFIHGLRSSGYFDIRKLNGDKVHSSVSWKGIKLIESANVLSIDRMSI